MLAAMLLAVTDASAKFRGVSIALAFLLAVIALQTFISRYTLLTEGHALFSGINYVGDKILAPGLLLTTAALLVGSVIALVNIGAGRIPNLIVAIGIPAATYVVAGVIVPAYVTTFVVRPNELVRETPYIRNNIQLTRRAFDLDHVENVPTAAADERDIRSCRASKPHLTMYGYGIGGPCSPRCARFRKSERTTTFRILMSTVTSLAENNRL